MKLVKVKIIKQRSAIQTNFIYPPNYNKHKINPIKYENRGESIEYMIGTADDDFVCGGDIVEITEDLAESEVMDMVEKDKDTLEEEKVKQKEIKKLQMKNIRARMKKDKEVSIQKETPKIEDSKDIQNG